MTELGHLARHFCALATRLGERRTELVDVFVFGDLVVDQVTEDRSEERSGHERQAQP